MSNGSQLELRMDFPNHIHKTSISPSYVAVNYGEVPHIIIVIYNHSCNYNMIVMINHVCNIETICGESFNNGMNTAYHEAIGITFYYAYNHY